MKRCASLFALAAAGLVLVGWIDYDDKVPKTEPAFGKEFQGFQLKLSTANVEFEQETPEPVRIVIRNNTDRGSVLPPGLDPKDRHYALYVVLADKDGASSMFSRNLLPEGANPIVAGTVPAHAETELLSVPFSSLEVATVEEYENGLPSFDPGKSMAKAASLVPQIYTMKAVLLSSRTGKRPDVAVASGVWPILLLPKSAARMSEAERQGKLDRFLAKMGEGAYGGIGVSSQLAALGEVAVDPLIAMADKTGAGAVFESRIWAIVTLCSTGSKKAEEYILKRISDPIAFDDLAFLVWHSQALHSDRVTATLQDLAKRVVNGEEMPWEKRYGRESRGHGQGCLNYILKHFTSRGIAIADATAVPALGLEDPELVCLVIPAWKPSSPQQAAAGLKRFFLTPFVHPNLKRTVLRKLAAELGPAGFPPFDKDQDLDVAWHAAGTWLGKQKTLTPDETVQFLRTEVLWVRAPDMQRALIGELRQAAGQTFPVQAANADFAGRWLQTWRWALKTGHVPDDVAVRFLCNQMRVEGELDDSLKKALLAELKGRLGAEFPLTSATDINLDEDWPTCGNWLVEKGYFKPPKKKRPAAPTPTPPGVKASPEKAEAAPAADGPAQAQP